MKNWIQLQVKLYQSLREEAHSLLEKKSKSFDRYEKEFAKDQTDFERSDHDRLTSEFNEANLVFIGDYHTLRQSQRTVLRLLRDRAVKNPQGIGFEVLAPKQMKTLKAWLDAPTPKLEARLKDELKLETLWGSNFDTYKELFEFCHENKIEILPLFRAEKNLLIRDREVARLIAKKDQRLWVLFGEFHCARPHLPRAVQIINADRKILILQQNDDQATLKRLAESSLQKSMILKSRKNRFDIPLYCILHTPLWIKYQSFLERHLQDSSDNMFATFDAYEQITWSLKTLSQFLNDPRYPGKISEKDLLDFNLFEANDPNFFKSITKFKSAERSLALSQIRSSGVAVHPDHKALYISELTVNSCAQAAGLYLYLRWSQTRFNSDEFFKRAVAEALAFFMSKLLNHSRRPITWKKWNHLARTSSKRREAAAVLQAQNFIERFQGRKGWLKRLSPFQTQSAVALGRNLSDAAFEAFLAGEFSQARLIRLMKTKVIDELQAYQILVELKSVGAPFSSQKKMNW